MRRFITVALFTLLFAAAGRSNGPTPSSREEIQQKKTIAKAHYPESKITNPKTPSALFVAATRNSNQQNGAANYSAKKRDAASPPEHWTDVYTAGATVVIAFLAVCQFIVIILQLRILNGSLAETKVAAAAATNSAKAAITSIDASLKAQRAYLSVAGMDVNGANRQFTVMLYVSNTGQTAAHDVKCGYTIKILPASTCEAPDFPEMSIVKEAGTILPGDTGIACEFYQDIPVTENEWSGCFPNGHSGIQLIEKWFCVFVSIKYRDAFGNRWETKRFYYLVGTQADGYSYRMGGYHNDAT